MITVEGSWCLHLNAWCCLAAFTAFTPSTHGWTCAQDFWRKGQIDLHPCGILFWDRMKHPILEIKARQVIANRTEDRCLPSPHPFGAQTFLSGGIHQSHYTYDIDASWISLNALVKICQSSNLASGWILLAATLVSDLVLSITLLFQCSNHINFRGQLGEQVLLQQLMKQISFI